MRVIVRTSFNDKYTRNYIKENDEIEISDTRYQELISSGIVMDVVKSEEPIEETVIENNSKKSGRRKGKELANN